MRKPAILLSALAVITALHFSLHMGGHTQHVVHVTLRTAYLFPVIVAAVWYGRRGGLLTAAAAIVVFVPHVLLDWANQQMENVSQIASGAVFLLVGWVVGALVDQRDRERERAAAAVQRARRLAIVKAIAALSAALDTRDRHTARHSEEVARVARQLGHARGLSADRLEVLRLAALMHDVGKIGVPDDVLFKTDSLTPEERDVIQQHPVTAGGILEAIDGTRDIADIVVAHHECPDGSGYPLGLRADQIPVEAAILSVADVFVALTEQRPYKEARSPEAALAWMQSVSGSKLDAESVRVLADVMKDARPLGPV